MTNAFKLLATGDIFIDGQDPGRLLEPVAGVLSRADCLIGNFEAPASDRGEPNPEKIVYGSKKSIRMPPEAVSAVKKAGFHLVSVANNHSLDYGEDAFLDTIDLLDNAGIGRAGGGRDLDEARRPAFFEVSGVRIALLSATFVYNPVTFPATASRPGVYCIAVDTSYAVPINLPQAPGVWPQAVTRTRDADRTMLLDDIRSARQQADIVVVAAHWGISGYASATAMRVPLHRGPVFVADYQHEMGRAMIDAGASLVIGNHPHKLQPVEFHGEGLIAYSLGNLAFGYEIASFGRTAALLEASIDPRSKSLKDFRLLPLYFTSDPYIGRPATDDEVDLVLQEMADLSGPYNVTLKRVGDSIHIDINSE